MAAKKKKQLFDAIRQGAGGALNGMPTWDAPAAPLAPEPAQPLTQTADNFAPLQALIPTGPAAAPQNYNPPEQQPLDLGNAADMAQQIRNLQRLGRHTKNEQASVLGDDEIGDYIRQRDQAAREWDNLSLGDALKNPIYAGGTLLNYLGYGVEDTKNKVLDSDKAKEIDRRVAAYNEATDYKPNTARAVIDRGAANFNAGTGNTLDFLVGENLKRLGWKDNPVSKFADALRSDQTVREGDYQRVREGKGKAGKIAMDVGSSAVEALPDMILMMLSYGQSGAAKGAGELSRDGARLLGREAAGAGASRLAGQTALVRQIAENSVRNPAFWTSFSRTTGNYYYDARQNGASEREAALYALLAGVVNSQLEAGSGFQKLPFELPKSESALKAWVHSMFEEGWEEVVQGIVERGLQNLTYGADNPLWSVEDENAVLNPLTAAKEFGMGAAVSAVLGAPSSISQGVSNVRSRPTAEAQAEAETPAEARPAVPVEQMPQNATESPVSNPAPQTPADTGKTESAPVRSETRQSDDPWENILNMYLGNEDAPVSETPQEIPKNTGTLTQEEVDAKAHALIEKAGRTDGEYDAYKEYAQYAYDDNLRQIKADIESGLDHDGLLRKAYEADKNYRELQASIPYGRSYTQEQARQLNLYQIQMAYYETAARDPQRALREIEELLSAEEQSAAPEPQENPATQPGGDADVDAIADTLNSGKKKVHGYTVFRYRDTTRDGATITVKRPDGTNIKQRIDGGRYYTNEQLNYIAAQMIVDDMGGTPETDAESLNGGQNAPTSSAAPYVAEEPQRAEKAAAQAEAEQSIPTAAELKARMEEMLGRPLTNADLDSMTDQELADRIRPAMEQSVPTDANGLPQGQGAASAGFDPYSAWQNESDSFHREGEKAARPVELPTENRDGLRTMKGGQTVMEAEQTPTERADQLAGVYVDGGLAYTPVKNAELAQSAEAKIERDGWEKSLRDWTADVRSGKLNNELLATGAVLLNNAGNSGMDARSYLDLASDYVVLTHKAGQALQASRILKNLTPSARLYMMQRSIYSIAEEAGIDDAEINPELAEKYMKAETDKERDAVIGEIQADIASRLKATAMDKWTALRYTNMLGNFKTQVRNLAGNTIMGIEAAIRRRLDAALHGGLHVMTGGKHQREVSAFYAPSLYSAAWSDFENVKSYAKGESKFSDINSPFQANDFLRGINDKKRIFKFAPLEGYRKLTQWAMEAGDDIFIRLTYADAMAQYLNAHGVKDGAALRSGEVGEELLYAARQYAAREAQEATFHDTNAFSSWVSQIGRRKDTPKAARIATEGLSPFRKTPANILVRAVEYSPLGTAASLLNTIEANNANADVDVNDAIRSWSKTMTGSALLVAGFTLARMGILRGKDDDDDKKAAFDHLRGHQEYSIEIGGKSYTIDAFAPSCLPLLVGAEAARLTRDNGWDVKSVESALSNLADPMINMSMLQGVNDALDNIKFSDNSLIQMAELSIFNYLTQGMTNTLAGQLERTFEPNRMTTYTDSDSPLPEWMQKAIGKASAKTPGWDFQQTEYLDAWGQPQSNGEPLERAARNLIAPWYSSEISSDSVERELERLYDETGDSTLFPAAYPPKQMKFDGVSRNATQSEKESYQKSAGGAAHDALDELFKSDKWDELTTEEKAKAITSLYEYSRARGNEAAGADVSDPDWYGRADGSVSEQAAFYSILQSAKQALDEDDRDKGGAIIGAVLDRGMSEEDTLGVLAQGLTGEKVAILEKIESASNPLAFARNYFGVYEARQTLPEDEQGKSAPQLQAILDSGVSDRTAMEQFKIALGENGESAFNHIQALQKAGMPLENIVAFYNAKNEEYAVNEETGKPRKRNKKEQIAWLMETYGYSYATAKYVYDEFAGNHK